MFNLVAPLIVLGMAATLWWGYGWQAGVASLCMAFTSYVLGSTMLRAALAKEGYVTEYRPDGTGKKRWRMGLQSPPKKVAAPEIEWIAPAK